MLFFCINLVFATSNTRIINENDLPDIIVNLGVNDYVLTDAVIHPITKNNINTYIVKENMKVVFSFANHQIESNYALINNYYYTSYKNKNIIIRCMDKVYIPGTEVDIATETGYQVLKATKRLGNCLFTFDVNYKVQEDGKSVDKKQGFYFMIVPEKEFEMYKSMTKVEEEVEKGVIKRPKAKK